MAKAAERFPVLDGLRALAIILVMLRFSIAPFWRDASQPFLNFGGIEFGSFFMNGWAGVDLFFVLSGFLIASHLMRICGDNGFKMGDLAVYFQRRFLRIAPAYYLVLTITCIGIAPFLPHVAENVWGWRYFYHLFFLQDYLPPDINLVFWSVAVEMKFYLLAPVLIMLLLRLPLTARYAVMAALFLLVCAARYWTVGNIPPLHDYMSYFYHIRIPFHLSLDGLVAGVAAAMLWQGTARKFIEKKAVANALFFGGILLVLLLLLPAPIFENDMSVFDTTALVSLLSLGFTAMMLGLLGGSKGQKLFSARPLAAIAAVSYSLYLVSRPILYPALLAARAVAPDRGSGFSDAGAWIFVLPFYAFFTATVGSALYFLVEKPAIEWGKRYEKAPKQRKKPQYIT